MSCLDFVDKLPELSNYNEIDDVIVNVGIVNINQY